MSQQLIDAFYGALAARDGEAMAACYHDDALFEDPIFGELNVGDTRDMWRMLCSSDTDLSLTHTVLRASETTASANWIATYTFSATGRPVTNDVTASLQLSDGLIIDHRDDFSFYKWSSQALGLPGTLLGWTPILKGKVRKESHAALAAFQATQ